MQWKLRRGTSVLLLLLIGFFCGESFAMASGASKATPNLANLAQGAKYWVSQPPEPSYLDKKQQQLTDGEQGSPDFRDPAWQGYLRDEFRVLTVDLGANKPISKVTAGFLQDRSAGIYFPARILLLVSTNGRDWTQIREATREVFGYPAEATRKELALRDLELVARYVRIVFFTEVWAFLDEVEVWGEDRVVSVEGPTDLLDLKSRFLGQGESLPPAHLNVQEQETSFTNAYYPAGSDEALGVRHLMLIYTHHKWGLTDALPYVGYSEKSDKFLAPPKWKDWFFDSFLFLALRTPNTQRAFGSAAHASPATWSDWQWFLDFLFDEKNQLAAFNDAVEVLKPKLNDPSYKAKVIVMIPNPVSSQTDFGDPLGEGESLSFDSFSQEPQAALTARLKAVKAYMDDLLARWQERSFANLELVGLYWLAEEMPDSDLQLAHAVSREVLRKGLKFFWIPYYNAAGWSKWKQVGFDAAILQPNYMFNSTIPRSRLQEAAQKAKRFGMGLEIEADESVLESESSREKYLDYLRAGASLGFMKEALHGYYQGVNILEKAFISSNQKVRQLYNLTYLYVKGKFPLKDE